LIRHYSLSNDWRERDRYVLGIARSPNSRGGSQFIHESLRKGMTLDVAVPRNGFPLDASATQYLFLAGGIGITPILAMIRWCEANGRPWRLAYAVRNAERAAFLETLSQIGGGAVHLHCDEQESRVFDPRPWLSGAPQGEHVYCCGPAPMMAAVKEAAGHRDPASVHFEYFNAPSGASVAIPADARPFTIELRRSGRSLTVPADRTILQILEQNGIPVVSSCREGTCRTCETGVCEGAVEHRDFCLTPQEQEAGRTMVVCVSRAKSERLVLDL
jgi:vanillate O-demethylase ferredoxin subunit